MQFWCVAEGAGEFWPGPRTVIKTAVSKYHDIPFLSPLITSPRVSRHSTKLDLHRVLTSPVLRHACVKIRCQLVIVAKDECRPGWLAPIFHSNSPRDGCNTYFIFWQLNQQNNENLKSRITAGFNLKPEPLSQSEGRLLLALCGPDSFLKLPFCHRFLISRIKHNFFVVKLQGIMI